MDNYRIFKFILFLVHIVYHLPHVCAKANATMTLSFSYYTEDSTCDKAVWTVSICVSKRNTSIHCDLFNDQIYIQAECIASIKRSVINFGVDDVLNDVKVSIRAVKVETTESLNLEPKLVSLTEGKEETFRSNTNRQIIYLVADFSCLPNYYGKYCTIECLPDAKEYLCDEKGNKNCKPGYIKNEESNTCLKDLCAKFQNYCQNDGKCYNPSPKQIFINGQKPLCKCANGFEGEQCEAVSTVAPPQIISKPPKPKTPANIQNKNIRERTPIEKNPEEEKNILPLDSAYRDAKIPKSLGIYLELVHVLIIILICMFVGALIGIAIFACTRNFRDNCSCSSEKPKTLLQNGLEIKNNSCQGPLGYLPSYFDKHSSYQGVNNSYINNQNDKFGVIDTTCTQMLPQIQPGSTINTLQRLKYPAGFEIEPFFTPNSNGYHLDNQDSFLNTPSHECNWDCGTSKFNNSMPRMMNLDEGSTHSYFYGREVFDRNDSNSRGLIHDSYKKLANISVLPSSLSKRLSLINSDSNSSEHSMKYGNLVTLFPNPNMEILNGESTLRQDTDVMFSGLRTTDSNNLMINSRYDPAPRIGERFLSGQQDEDIKIISHDVIPQFVAETNSSGFNLNLQRGFDDRREAT